MLKVILQLIPLIILILKRVFGKRDALKSAEEALTETPVIDSVREEAERKAEEKFGPRTTPRPKADMPAALLETAGKYLGIKEIPGDEDHPQIVDWLLKHGKNINPNYVRKEGDEIAWCAVFVSAVLAENGIVGTEHGLARKYKTWGVPSKFKPGSIVVIRHKKARGDGTFGLGGYHVGFFLKMNKKYIWLRGGNQRNSVSDVAFAKKNIHIEAIREPRHGA